jgi:ubiquinone/menaquinone biosynthesis C-methylase UbiE
MSSFEKAYYESETFWQGDAVHDEANLLRIRETAAMIPDDVNSLTDVGCGNGVFLNHLQKESLRLRLLAIDRSRTALKYVQTDKLEADIAALPLADLSHDCVTCLEVIEHLPVDAFEMALSELARIAKRYVILSVPYDENLEKNHTQCPQCKSLFNLDLHFRSFSADAIYRLLQEHDFECVTTKKTGAQTSFKGHYRFEKIFYPAHFRSWRSPICPICGYKTKEHSVQQTGTIRSTNASSPRRSFISYLTVLPKLFWPKETTNYWIIALYKRRGSLE